MRRTPVLLRRGLGFGVRDCAEAVWESRSFLEVVAMANRGRQGRVLIGVLPATFPVHGSVVVRKQSVAADGPFRREGTRRRGCAIRHRPAAQRSGSPIRDQGAVSAVACVPHSSPSQPPSVAAWPGRQRGQGRGVRARSVGGKGGEHHSIAMNGALVLPTPELAMN